jgi:TonB family protein
MTPLLLTVLQFNLVVLIMVILYRSLLCSSRYHQLNRGYLLLVPTLALLIPFLARTSEPGMIYHLQLAELKVSERLQYPSDADSAGIIYGFWLLGSLIMLTRTLVNLYVVRYAFKHGVPGKSFTFLNRVQLDPQLHGNIKERVLMHELVHARQLHTLDLLLYELFRIIFWFNPAFSLAQTDLKNLHEYIADDVVNNTVPDYPESLIAEALGVNILPLANEFSKNNIKNRIKMIKKRKNPNQLISLVCASVIAFSGILLMAFTQFDIDAARTQDQQVYKVVEQMPIFPGCQESTRSAEEQKKCTMQKLGAYIGDNVEYPASAKKASVEGKVFVYFVVSENGSIKDAEVNKGAHPDLDAEALRVVQGMPDWTPGRQKGKNVSVGMTLPIVFALPKE